MPEPDPYNRPEWGFDMGYGEPKPEEQRQAPLTTHEEKVYRVLAAADDVVALYNRRPTASEALASDILVVALNRLTEAVDSLG